MQLSKRLVKRIPLCRNYSELLHNFITPVDKIRNVAIIAHVDHGKTTLVDCLLKQSGSMTSNVTERLMDHNALEKERGITILSKATSIRRNEYQINIVDTPGHADFGGEVERVLTMVDGVVLVVDASEGPMAQTKFVLTKALERGLLPIVVFNKVDRPSSRCDEVDSELFELFFALNANEAQMNYPTVYCSAREGWSFTKNPWKMLAEKDSGISQEKDYLVAKNGNMDALFDAILSRVPPPNVDRTKPFSLLVNSIESNPFLGKCFLGKIHSGIVKIGDPIRAIKPDGGITDNGKVLKMFVRRGLDQYVVSEAAAGDIISVAGIQIAHVNSTICSTEISEPLPSNPIDPPTISMVFSVNDSPLAGREGKAITSQILADRLKKETENNVALIVEPTEKSDSFEVRGRGELQLGILIETMRREGMELAISPPRVVYKDSKEGKLEPIEEVIIDVDQEYSGVIIEKLSKRKAELEKMTEIGNKIRLVFNCPTRGLLGYISEFKNDSHGTGVLNHSFRGYEKFKGRLEYSRKGCLISMASGNSTNHALLDLESRGTLFISPGMPVYEGMIIGECSRLLDLDVNPSREKQLTNVRSTVKDETVRLSPAKIMGLEEMMAYVGDDEIIEVTPKSIRLRKRELDKNKRRKANKSSA